MCYIKAKFIFLGPNSNHCLPLSIPDSLTNSTDMTLALEDVNLKLPDVISAADFDAEERISRDFESGVW